MNKLYKIYILPLVSIALFFHATSISAQVTIGAATPPESFATLQLEFDKPSAMNLPKVEEADKNSTAWKNILTASNASSGLVIFNTTKDCLEYWDGAAWITLTDDIYVDNGLHNDNGVIKLGGDLIRATNIVQGSYNFGMETSLGGKFVVKTIDNASTPISIVNNSISIQPKEFFSVNGTALKVKENIVNISTDKFQANINQGAGVSSTKFTLDTENARLDNLYYQSDVDPNNPSDSKHSGYFLTTDKLGNASWEALKPLGAVVTGKINDNHVAITSGDTDVTEKRIVLPAGQWLIFGLFNTETVVAAGGVVMYNWVSLARRPISSPSQNAEVIERLGGTNPESKAAGYTAYATPSFSHYLNVTKPTEIWVLCSSSNGNSNITVDGPSYGFLGPSYFFAVRLDVAIP